MKNILTTLAGLFVPCSLLAAAEVQTLTHIYLADLQREATRNHPASRSATLLAAAATRDLRALRLWDDPMIGLSLMAADSPTRRSDGDIRLSYEQPLPKRGLLQEQRAKSDALQRAEVENAVASTLEIEVTVAKEVIELALADESISLQSGQIQGLEKMAENARQMTLNPGTTPVDALRLEVELAKERSVLAAAHRTRSQLTQRLNLQLGRALDHDWPTLKLPDEPAPTPVAVAEIARIPHRNPKVRAMREMAVATKAEMAIVDRERQPKFSIGVDTNVYSGGGFGSASVGLKMSLPDLNRSSYDAKTYAAQLRARAAQKDIAATQLEVTTAVLTAITEAHNSATQARAYSGEIYQKSLQATQAVESAWISSKSSLTDLLAANRSLFFIRLEQRRFIAMQQVALQDLNLLVPSRN